MAKPKPHKRHKGVSRAGRPRKEGPRHACGKLKPETVSPNEVVLRSRRFLMGKPDAKVGETTVAENALDLQRLHRRAKFCSPTLKIASYGESRSGGGEGSSQAMNDFMEVCLWLQPDELAEIEKTVLNRSWPHWVVKRAMGDMQSGHERKRDLLLRGLAVARRAMERRAAA